MLPSELRAKLKEWLSQQLRIDRWGLNSPESIRDLRAPPSAGFDGKASGYSVVELLGTGETSSYLLETSIPFQVTYRFDNSCTYTEIPRGSAEDVLTTALLELQAHQSCLSPDIQEIESKGSVIVQEEPKSDWLLIFEIEFNVRFHCEFVELANVSGVFSP
jgi:hypothetical protein